MPEAGCNFIKKETCRRCFPLNFAKFLRTPFLYRTPLVVVSRGRHQRCSVKKGVLRNFAKFTGKHLCQSLFFLCFWRLPFRKGGNLVIILFSGLFFVLHNKEMRINFFFPSSFLIDAFKRMFFPHDQLIVLKSCY